MSTSPPEGDSPSPTSPEAGLVPPVAAPTSGDPAGFSLQAWLQLCRFAAVFTAMADIFAGYLIVRPTFSGAAGDPVPQSLFDFGRLTHRLPFQHDFFLLLASSSCLYLAGMVFNDVFDRHVDARERPRRPIPSGRVGVFPAVVFGSLLIAGGIVAAGLAGVASLLIALVLTACIFAYDGGLKQTPLGPVAMGLCRGFNILLGASTAVSVAGPDGHLLAAFGLPQIHVALAMTVYIAGVTWFARNEASVSQRIPLTLAAAIANLGLGLLLAFVLHAPDPHGQSFRAAVLLGIVTFSIDRRVASALIDPSPQNVQQAIRTMLLSLVMLDCALVFFSQRDPLPAAIVAAMTIPAWLLSRVLAVT